MLTNEQFEKQLLLRADTLRRHISRRIPRQLMSLVSTDDVLQDVWRTAFERIDRTTEIDLVSIDSWLVRMANNRLIDVIRRHNAVRRAKDARGTGRTSVLSVLYMTQADGRSPSSEAALNERASRVLRALDTLPNEQHKVVRLRYVEGFSIDHIATDMNRTKGSVRGLLARGLQQLRHTCGSSAQEGLQPGRAV